MGMRRRRWLSWLLPGLLLAAAAAGCRDKPKNRVFGERCDNDTECTSNICSFEKQADTVGRCTEECRMEGEETCPTGTTCTTIVRHAGKDTPVCGKPPPLPFGDGVAIPAGPAGAPGLPPGGPGLPPGVLRRPPPGAAPGGTAPAPTKAPRPPGPAPSSPAAPPGGAPS